MENYYVLEITLISAQGLKEPSSKLRRMQTYALAWIDSSVKLRTCALTGGVSAIGFRDLIGESLRARTHRSIKKSKSAVRLSRENSFRDSDDQSDGCDSTTSSSSTASRALREWNEVARELEGTNHVRSSSDGGILLCGLVSSPRKATCLGTLMSSQSFNEGKLVNGRSRFA